MSGFRIEGDSGNILDVTPEGEVKASLSLVPANIGGVRLFSENDDGSITGKPLLRSPETSLDYRLRVGSDTLLFADEFNATAQNTALWWFANSTMTMVQSGGFLVTNSGLAATSGNGCGLATKRVFTLYSGAALCAEFRAGITAVPLAGQNAYWGFGNMTSGTAEVADGAFFKLTAAGLTGCIKFGGSLTETAVIKTPAQFIIGEIDKYAVVVGTEQTQFWCNDVLLGVLDTPAGNSQPFIQTATNLFIQQFNSAAIAGSPQMQMKFGSVCVTMMDILMNKTWAGQMAAMGLMATQGQNGGTMGQTAQWSNTALPTAAAATNTTAALGTGLGGLYQLNAPATSATDVIIDSFQNPAGSITQSPSCLHVRGIWIDVTNTGAAVATTATILALALAFGHTAVSLATAESGSFANNTAKAPRRLPLGTAAFKVGDAIGQNIRFEIDFETPIVVNPGEFVALVAKPVLGTATASEVFLFNVGFNAYYE